MSVTPTVLDWIIGQVCDIPHTFFREKAGGGAPKATRPERARPTARPHRQARDTPGTAPEGGAAARPPTSRRRATGEERPAGREGGPPANGRGGTEGQHEGRAEGGAGAGEASRTASGRALAAG